VVVAQFKNHNMAYFWEKFIDPVAKNLHLCNAARENNKSHRGFRDLTEFC